ncbi:MAG: hypothetical protein KDA61_00365, partial [Planctomycetales bacterium]|nr:hypothetical protein [Planctomycetales bacterium]
VAAANTADSSAHGVELGADASHDAGPRRDSPCSRGQCGGRSWPTPLAPPPLPSNGPTETPWQARQIGSEDWGVGARERDDSNAAPARGFPPAIDHPPRAAR